MLSFFLILGALLLVTSAVCACLNIRRWLRKELSKMYFFLAIGLGLLLGFLALGFSWQYDEMTRIAGFPFAAAAFQKSSPDGPYLDFVGPLTGVFLCLDALTWALIPQFLLFFVLKLSRKANES